MLLLGEGTVITRNPAQPMITRGAVVMDGKTIIAVGGYDELKAKYPDATVINAHGKLIMPAFINAHHHIYSALARGLALPNYNPTNFNEILEGMWFYLDNNLNRNSVWASAVATYMPVLKTALPRFLTIMPVMVKRPAASVLSVMWPKSLAFVPVFATK